MVPRGELPRTARRIIKEWNGATELFANWERGRMKQTFFAVQGADEDD